VTDSTTEAAVHDVVDWTVDGLGARDGVRLPVVHGEADPVIGVEHATRYQAEFPSAQIAILEDAGQGCYNLAHIALPMVADWLSQATLRGGS
jgi:pimeloyl-ACP methyl ester carboxylesterase